MTFSGSANRSIRLQTIRLQTIKRRNRKRMVRRLLLFSTSWLTCLKACLSAVSIHIQPCGMVQNKAVQLRLARKSGLKVPETLFSNSAAAVRKFFDRHPTDAICKAFAAHVWQQQGSTDISVTETFCLNREELPADDEVFTYAPAIYQQKVRKQFDVRMVLMGERVYSFAVRTPANSLDWRHDAALRNVIVECVDTPAGRRARHTRFRPANRRLHWLAGPCRGPQGGLVVP